MIARIEIDDRYESEIDMLPEIPPGFLESGDGPLIGFAKGLAGLLGLMLIVFWFGILPWVGLHYLIFR